MAKTHKGHIQRLPSGSQQTAGQWQPEPEDESQTVAEWWRKLEADLVRVGRQARAQVEPAAERQAEASDGIEIEL